MRFDDGRDLSDNGIILNSMQVGITEINKPNLSKVYSSTGRKIFRKDSTETGLIR